MSTCTTIIGICSMCVGYKATVVNCIAWETMIGSKSRCCGTLVVWWIVDIWWRWATTDIGVRYEKGRIVYWWRATTASDELPLVLQFHQTVLKIAKDLYERICKRRFAKKEGWELRVNEGGQEGWGVFIEVGGPGVFVEVRVPGVLKFLFYVGRTVDR